MLLRAVDVPLRGVSREAAAVKSSKVRFIASLRTIALAALRGVAGRPIL
jgi:hypothetical protein